jgi:hypothetical protein
MAVRDDMELQRHPFLTLTIHVCKLSASRHDGLSCEGALHDLRLKTNLDAERRRRLLSLLET